MGLKLSNVRKKYGEKIVVDDISFEMNRQRCIWITWYKWCWKNYNN